MIVGKKDAKQLATKQCNECQRVFPSLNALSLHVKFKHDLRAYYDRYFKKDEEGICPNCNSETKYVSWSEGYRKFCSKKCRLDYMSGENHPMFGKRGSDSPLYGRCHSEETKKKIAAGRKGKDNPFYGKKHSLKNRRKWSKDRTGESHPMFGRRGESSPLWGRRGRVLTEEAKQRISKTLCDKYVRGELCYKNKKFCNGTFESIKFGKSFWYRSSFELEALKIFEGDDSVIGIEAEFVVLEYLLDGKTRRYIPDFRVMRDSCVVVIEVKASWELEREKFKAKLEALREYCEENNYGCEVWTEYELGLDR